MGDCDLSGGSDFMTVESRSRETEPSLVIRLDTALVCITAVGDGTRSLGIAGETLIGKFFPELLAPSEMPAVIETLRSVVEERRGAIIIASFDLSGMLRWVELTVTPARVNSEDRASIEIEFQEHGSETVEGESRYRSLIDNMRDSLCEIGEDGRILYASPSYAELFGGSLDGLLGSDPVESVHVDDRRRVSHLFRPGARSRRQGTLVYRAQSILGVPLHLEATAREFIGEDGRPHVVVSTRNVTERENARRSLERHIALEARVAELSRVFIDLQPEAIHDGIMQSLAHVAELAESEHSWTYSLATSRSEAENFDWWRDDDLKNASASTTSTGSASLARFPYSTGMITKGRVYQVTDVDALPEQAESERKDMLERGVRSILGIPIMSNGQFAGFLGFESFEREINWPEETIVLLRMVGEIFFSALRRRRSVEELRHSQSQLLQSQKMEAVGTLAGGIAHDFNNHLAVMLGNARFVRQEIDADPEVMSAIEDFERSADHCAQLTRSLLAFSRRTPAEILPVEVAELVKGVEGLVRPLLPSSIVFESRLMPDLGSFAVDRVQIQQVLVNLLVNARDAMPDGGPIHMHACRRPISAAESSSLGLDEQSEYVVLSVEDAGHGMSEEVKTRAFEPFFTTKDVGHGTGLGLATAYGIVRQSEGAISVDSHPGEGTTFRVYVPSVEEGSAELAASDAGSLTAAAAPGRIIVVEDEPAVRRLVGRILTNAGYAVDIRCSIEDAASFLDSDETHVDLVVAGLVHSQNSVASLLAPLRRSRDGLRILVLTGFSGAPHESGPGLCVLQKPFDEESLLSAVRELLTA
ncbi:MAG TPA: PAS domain S-box protein [Myxococcales bacterium]|nr:PAS domain S-box protein [Myxococcales bacterium]HIK84695.1 PAS domain S-box protein [Myxococcales bacterium]